MDQSKLGFNPSVVTNSINQVKNAYRAYMDAMNTGIQNRFVKPMESVWAAQDAYDFFNNNYKPAIDGLYNAVEASLSSVVEVMSKEAANWAATTGNAATFTTIAHESIPNASNVDGIQKEIGGNIFIDENQANSISAVLPQLGSEAETALNQAVQAVATCGFLGGQQQSSLTASLTKIKNDAKNIVDSLVHGAEQGIKNTVSAYNTQATNASSSMTAQ